MKSDDLVSIGTITTGDEPPLTNSSAWKSNLKATLCNETIYHGISRAVKHISVIACASAAGESLIPYFGV
jgi:hypothetical protein